MHGKLKMNLTKRVRVFRVTVYFLPYWVFIVTEGTYLMCCVKKCQSMMRSEIGKIKHFYFKIIFDVTYTKMLYQITLKATLHDKIYSGIVESA